ncbi:MAG: hypothetical protein ACO1ON_09290, partial [Nocardioides sp.]
STSGNCRCSARRSGAPAGCRNFPARAPSPLATRESAKGEGALAGKFRHPAVAPHLRALQRQFPLVEQLLEA